MTLFTASDYATLKALTFRPDYPGYRPTVVESPNGDGVLDVGKSYSHVAIKYFPEEDRVPTRPMKPLFAYLRKAWVKSCQVASDLRVPPYFHPAFGAGALRILHYPPGTTSALHTDMSLFTVMCYRNVANPGLPDAEVHIGELGELLGLGPATPHEVRALDVPQESIVYFAVPDHAQAIPGTGMSVGEWIAERMKRSRYDVK